MTTNDLKLLSFYFAKMYVVMAVIYCVYIWTVEQTYHASIRTAIALFAFAVITLLPERFAKTQLTETLVMFFGVTGTTILLLVTIFQSK